MDFVKGLAMAACATLGVAVPTGALLLYWGVLSPCPQPPFRAPDWVTFPTAWAFFGSPLVGLVAGVTAVVRSRRRRDASPSASTDAG